MDLENKYNGPRTEEGQIKMPNFTFWLRAVNKHFPFCPDYIGFNANHIMKILSKDENWLRSKLAPWLFCLHKKGEKKKKGMRKMVNFSLKSFWQPLFWGQKLELCLCWEWSMCSSNTTSREKSTQSRTSSVIAIPICTCLQSAEGKQNKSGYESGT